MGLRPTLFHNGPRCRETPVRLVNYSIQSRENLGGSRFEEFEVFIAQRYQILKILVAGLHEFEADADLVGDAARVCDCVEG